MLPRHLKALVPQDWRAEGHVTPGSEAEVSGGLLSLDNHSYFIRTFPRTSRTSAQVTFQHPCGGDQTAKVSRRRLPPREVGSIQQFRDSFGVKRRKSGCAD
nr:hypothetical protein CFP56_74701 [Quercus suber]